MNLYRALRPLLFRLGRGDPETAHERALRALELLSRHPAVVGLLRRHYGVSPAVSSAVPLAASPAVSSAVTSHVPSAASVAAASIERTVFGLRFPSPVGLAAGMDKDGRALPAWPALGFGFVEVGTVTRDPQPGNPRPRLFRLPANEAIINRMGFNNAGAAALAARLEALGPLPVPLGISIGKSKATPLAEAVTDYVSSLRVLYRYGDYFAVNVSSPNTPGLRTLQDRDHLAELLAALNRESRALAGTAPPRPLLVKLSPDLTDSAVAELLEVCLAHGVAGVIATNTTTSRDGLAGADAPAGMSGAAQQGGLSGRPLTRRSRDVVRFVSRETGGRLPVIGVGGILDADDALRMFDAGASLVQVYTGLVYRGPDLIRRINRAVARPGTYDASE